MFLIASLILHFDALTRLVCPASCFRSCASFWVRMPFSSSLLMSASADCARTSAVNSVTAIAPTAKCLNIRFVFIAGWFQVVLHTGNLDRTRYEDASRMLRFCDKGQAMADSFDDLMAPYFHKSAANSPH